MRKIRNMILGVAVVVAVIIAIVNVFVFGLAGMESLSRGYATTEFIVSSAIMVSTIIGGGAIYGLKEFKP